MPLNTRTHEDSYFFLVSLGLHVFSGCLTFPSGFNTAATSHRPTYDSSSTLHVHRPNITSMAFQDFYTLTVFGLGLVSLHTFTRF
jgi:hypothetical protein